MSVTKIISNTLFRILPPSTTTTTTTTTSGVASTSDGNGSKETTVEAHGDKEHGDTTSFSTGLSCSSCVSSCPSYVNEKEPLGPYRLVKTLGIGEFGKIKLGIHTETEQKVAIKVIKKKNHDDAKLAKVEREIQVLKSLRHPHIVKLIDVFETDTRIGIILEYASGGELFEYVLSHSSLEEDVARNLFAQLISSVYHMHMKDIVHRDLKLENLLFLDSQQTHIIVSDFGFANSDANNKDLLSTCCGSPTYAAPELVYPSGGYKGPAADVWSCGIILYCMVCGYLPFDDDPENPESANLHQLYRYIRSTNALSIPNFVSDDAQDLIRKMLQHDPAKRCSVEAIINHPWLQAY
ncbi:kinase-like domain-containing protein, partial [Absidia repens]